MPRKKTKKKKTKKNKTLINTGHNNIKLGLFALLTNQFVKIIDGIKKLFTINLISIVITLLTLFVAVWGFVFLYISNEAIFKNALEDVALLYSNNSYSECLESANKLNSQISQANYVEMFVANSYFKAASLYAIASKKNVGYEKELDNSIITAERAKRYINKKRLAYSYGRINDFLGNTYYQKYCVINATDKKRNINKALMLLNKAIESFNIAYSYLSTTAKVENLEIQEKLYKLYSLTEKYIKTNDRIIASVKHSKGSTKSVTHSTGFTNIWGSSSGGDNPTLVEVGPDSGSTFEVGPDGGSTFEVGPDGGSTFVVKDVSLNYKGIHNVGASFIDTSFNVPGGISDTSNNVPGGITDYGYDEADGNFNVYNDTGYTTVEGIRIVFEIKFEPYLWDFKEESIKNKSK